MDVGASVVAALQAPVLVQPGDCALDDPALFAEPRAVAGFALGDSRCDPALSEFFAVLAAVVIEAGPLVAFGDANDPHFARIDELLRTVDGPLIVPAPSPPRWTTYSDSDLDEDHGETSSPISPPNDLPLSVWSARTMPRSGIS